MSRDRRVIDRLRGRSAGPTLILIGGVHGNEPAGVDAARRLLSRLRRDGVEILGDIVGLIGNVRALAARRRYLARDLNRLWTPAQIASAQAGNGRPESGLLSPNPEGAELEELAELSSELDRIIAGARGRVFAIDLHTTSAAGIPFGVLGATVAHREFAQCFPMPSIVGLEELIDGVLTRYLGDRGLVTLAVEGGQTGNVTAAANLEAVIALALVTARVVARDQVPGLAEARAVLTRACGDLPQLIEVVSRHDVKPGDGFCMEPGFANIEHTAAGTLLAHDRSGEIRAPFDGLVLLPLYQPQGSDGFFYGRAVA